MIESSESCCDASNGCDVRNEHHGYLDNACNDYVLEKNFDELIHY